jgi:hypothetical protein
MQFRSGVLLLTAFAALAYAAPAALHRLVYEEPDLAAAQAQLDRKLAAVRARNKVKHTLIGELIEGQLSLSEVTDEFIRLNREDPERLANIRAMFPGADERESTARQVIAWTEETLKWRRDPTSEACRRVRDRLEAERREMSQ